MDLSDAGQKSRELTTPPEPPKSGAGAGEAGGWGWAEGLAVSLVCQEFCVQRLDDSTEPPCGWVTHLWTTVLWVSKLLTSGQPSCGLVS